MIEFAEYAKRREHVKNKIGKNGVLILAATPIFLRNGDVDFSYRQHSDLYYLTGFNEPETILMLLPEREEGEFILFNRVRIREEEIWNGVRAGQEGACAIYGADQSFPYEEFSSRLPELVQHRSVIHYSLGLNKGMDMKVVNCLNSARSKIRSGVVYPETIVDIAPLIHDLRLIKSEAELALMQTAVDISIEGHQRAMQFCQPNVYEYQLEAELLHAFCRHGARSPAYPSIVGSGKNTCILHYVDNCMQIQDGDLVLIDAGAEYHNYAADITRTFPANGRFSHEQAEVYELVLAAQQAAIAVVRPGTKWDEPQRVVVDVLTRGLIELGILHGRPEELIEQKAYFPYYMHRSGHWLGLDVHDVGAYRTEQQWRALEQNMVFTIEPGLYFAADIPGLDAKWHNIGIRIEDDVVVTEQGCRVLSEKLIKKKDDIEYFMQHAK